MLTWESPKEMIFEMPVRSRVPRFSVSRAAHASALPEMRATPARARECTLSSRRCAAGRDRGFERAPIARSTDRNRTVAPLTLRARFVHTSPPPFARTRPLARSSASFERCSSGLTRDLDPLSSSQTGGAAIMRKGPNLLKLARKEQCLALLNSMRAKNKINGCVYRVFPSGEVQYLHPKDGVYPEKVNKGRVGANNNMRSIGKNANPASIKFGGKLGADGLASDGAGFSRVFDQ